MKANFYLRKKDVNGFSTLYFYISNANRQVYISTGFKLKDSDWDKKRQIAKDEEINAELAKFIKRGEMYIESLNGELPTNESFKQFFNGAKKEVKCIIPKASNSDKSQVLPVLASFIKQAPNRLNSNGERISQHRVSHYTYLYNTLAKFEKKCGFTLYFEDFDTNTLTGYQNYLTSKGLANNTIIKYLKLLWVIFRYAENLDIKVNQAFRKFKTHTNKKDSVVLSEQEIKMIWSYQAESECENNVKKLFLIGLHTGLRYSDYSQLNSANIDYNSQTITTIQQKTGQRVTIPLHPSLANMLQNDTMPHSISGQKFNKYLKEMMKKIGFNSVVEIKKIVGGKRLVEYKQKWELISSHTARRSFATNLYKQGVNPSIIMMLTGHHDLQSFMKYIVLSNEDKLDVVRNLWSSAAV